MNHEVKIGDIVGRKSYGKDILFRVIEINQQKGEAILKGIDWRLIADAPLGDLEIMEEDEVERIRLKVSQPHMDLIRQITYSRHEEREKKSLKYNDQYYYFERPGRVFHMDGDPQYLKLCLEYYEKLGIPAAGIYIEEKKMPDSVLPLLEEYHPDILIITGHDSYRSRGKDWGNIKNYRNSAYFIDTVKKVRKHYERHRDDLIIFAGACQSFFEAILAAGANFASAPARVNIHALDPVYIAEKAAFTPIRESIPLMDIVGNTITGREGIGGIETIGTFRLGFPSELQ